METVDWNNPDHYFVAIHIQGVDQVYGKVKNNLGLLEGIPLPETGLCFGDVVTVEGPVGKQPFRDEYISIYSAGNLYAKSKYKTFSFQAQLPDYDSFFHLKEIFLQHRLDVRVHYPEKNAPLEWKLGLCAAETLAEAESLIKAFLKKNRKAFIGNLEAV